ncbi:hypothetical protein FRACYDRAFT_252436 [Fragilariopsis cylindrus CCMP1102]|uniref:BTB domain-containing protein n=1 Tax=Fragilariopsis cylindrus CCMP1102 TaxID=635003 RepID=A0A1E7EM85_9STRA|nr:hypothetical protein FRACYDRAFT_252436 [Fragilariopsis cylindrus CCMP1102]|eukprot:OEU07028.1 hypothetical protein FRACYDRAFT_252436 [Fragilariopsis cylindrus CCMP1102]
MEVDDSISNNVYLLGSSREKDPPEQEITRKRQLPSWTKSSAYLADDESEAECSDWTLDIYFNNNSASFDISSKDIAGCMSEIDKALNLVESYPDRFEDVNVQNLVRLKAIFINFEEHILKGLPQQATSYQGDRILEIFEQGTRINFDNHQLVLVQIEIILDMFMEIHGGNFNGAPKLELFVQCLKLVFGEPTESRCQAKTQAYRSEYFKGIFRLDTTGVGYSESHQKCSTIKLPAPVVTIQHFETLLDYLYTGKLKLNDTNAVSMVYFGDYFGINLLKEKAQRFLRRNIDDCKGKLLGDVDGSVASGLLAKFYRDANSLAMEDLLNAIAYSCAHQPRLMSKDNALSKIPDVHLWCRVFAVIRKKKYSNDNVAESMSELCSINLANFIKRYPDIVDVESFNILTESNSLPNISAKAAIILMEYEQNLSLADLKNGGDDLTCLQQRCIDALVNSKTGPWNDSNPRTLLQGKLRKLQPFVLESLVLRLMNDDDKRRPPSIKPRRCFL